MWHVSLQQAMRLAQAQSGGGAALDARRQESYWLMISSIYGCCTSFSLRNVIVTLCNIEALSQFEARLC